MFWKCIEKMINSLFSWLGCIKQVTQSNRVMGWKHVPTLRSLVFYHADNFSSCHTFSRVAKSISRCWFCICAIVIIYWLIFSFLWCFPGLSFPRSSIFFFFFWGYLIRSFIYLIWKKISFPISVRWYLFQNILSQ